jgi:hypothetical protein
MKKLPAFLLVLCCATLVACGKGSEINGHNLRTADKSARVLKERLPPENRVEFEISYWTIRDEHKNVDEFLDAVDGKTPLEIIALGKEIYQQRKDKGLEKYAQYASWEDMISKFMKDRPDQDNRKPRKNDDAKNNSILYDLH